MINRIAETLLQPAARKPKVAPEVPVPTAEQVADSAKEWLQQAKQLIVSHPGFGLAAAMGAGMLLGWWVKRK